MTFLETRLNNLRPDRFFLFCALFFGLVFLVITPPFQTPDELSHFYRAYQLSEGDFIGVKQDQRVGGNLPVSLANSYEPFRYIRRHAHVTTKWVTIQQQFNRNLHEQDRKFIDFPNTGMYSFVCYIPQAIGIFIVRNFNSSPICIFYGGRLVALLFWAVSIFFVIRLLPFYKWLFTLLALLPMSIASNMSLSADVMTNVVSFLVIAYSFHLAYKQERIAPQHMLFFVLLGILLALAKVVYLPLLLLFFLIPQEKFGDKRSYFTQMILLFAVSSATALAWSAVMKGLYVPYKLYNPIASEDHMLWASMVSCANMPEQLQYILNQSWWYIPYVMVKSMLYAFPMYSQSYIGTFGWLDTFLPIWTVVAGYIVILAVARWDSDQQIFVGRRFKLLLIACFGITLFLILISQLLTWVCVGVDHVSIIQGRYMVPILPLVFMLSFNPKGSRRPYVAPTVCAFSLILLSYSSYVIYERYFVVAEVEKNSSFFCDAEKVVDKSFTTDSTTVFLDNADTRSKEKSRSGNYSSKVSSKNPYTFTYRLYNCKFGDSIMIDAYRWGKRGGIMISGEEDNFHVFTDEPISKDSLGWEHLQSKIMVPADMKRKEVGMFIYYNEGNDSSYFDDITIRYRKLK